MIFRREPKPQLTGQQRRAKANKKASRDGEQAFVLREQARDRAVYNQAPAPKRRRLFS